MSTAIDNVGVDVGEGVVVRYDEKAKKVVGLTIIGAVRIYALKQFREIAGDFKLNEP
jgi:hypothetical protein